MVMELLTNVQVPSEGIYHKEENVETNVHGHGTLGSGTLFIAESQVTWMCADGRGLCLDYPSISLHAVSRDLNAFPQECLYLMVENLLGAAPGSDSNSDNEDNDEGGKVSEVRFVPNDKSALETMFQSMSDCQTLHPDPEDSFSEEEGQEGGGDHQTEQTGAVILTQQGQRTLQHLEQIFDAGESDTPLVGHPNGDIAMETPGQNEETGQFDDADMES